MEARDHNSTRCATTDERDGLSDQIQLVIDRHRYDVAEGTARRSVERLPGAVHAFNMRRRAKRQPDSASESA
jgi:hypothetical protein